MTKQENERLATVATDIQWIKAELGIIKTHLISLNGAKLTDATNIAKNKMAIESIIHSINRQWMVIGTILSTLLTLKFTGVL